MPMVSLKNRGAGPRGVIDVRGKSFVLPHDPTREAPAVEIEVDDITLRTLQEGSEAGGDFEVTSTSGAGRARMNLGGKGETPEQKAARERHQAEEEKAARERQQQHA